MSVLLAFDVSTSVGSVAVARSGEILARRFLLDGRGHAAGLVPAIARALEEAEVRREAVEGIVVGKGPGSFTGVRIAAATARGLALGLALPLWPRSSLAAAAASRGVWIPEEVARRGVPELGGEEIEGAGGAEGEDARPHCVLFDARDDRVYAACYRFIGPEGLESSEDSGSSAGADAAGPAARAAPRIETVLAPCAATLPEILEGELPRDTLFSGDGALRHAYHLAAAGHPILAYPTGLPTAEGLMRLHALFPGEGPEPPGSGWEPEYLRGSSARRPAIPGGRAP